MTHQTPPPPAAPRARLSVWAHVYGAGALLLLAACWMQLVTIAANL